MRETKPSHSPESNGVGHTEGTEEASPRTGHGNEMRITEAH